MFSTLSKLMSKYQGENGMVHTNSYITKDYNKNKLLSNPANLFSLASLFFIHSTNLKHYDYILERNITRSFIRQRR